MGDTPEEDEASDEQLVERFRMGEARAGTELFCRHRGALWAFFRAKTGSDADDLVQLTFLAFLEAKDRFRSEASVKTFLFGIANRQLFAYYRRNSRDPAGLLVDLDDIESPLSALTSLESEHRVRRTLGRIPEELRLVVHLHYWRSLSVPQIASILQLPVGTVASRLRRARRQIREIFQADSRPM